MPAPNIPATMDEVTPEWLTAALRSSGVLKEASVVAAPRIQIGAGVGILGELARVTLAYDRPEPGAPKTLIAKIPTADPAGRHIANILGYYEREVRYYLQVGPRNVVGTPACYYGDMDPENVLFIVLLEDLCDIRIGDQLAGCTAEDACLVVNELAKLHARWWTSPDLAELDWIPPANSPMLKLAQGTFLDAVDGFMAKLGHLLTPEQQEIARKLGPRMNAMQDEFCTGPQTMLHADVRLDNIFFGASHSASPMTLIDWQILVKGRGPYDVGYFLSQSIDPAERRAIEEPALRDYHRVLAENGVQGYSWEQCWGDYRLATLFCLAYPVISAGSIDLANERGVALVTAMAIRSITAITDLNCAELLDRFAPSEVASA